MRPEDKRALRLILVVFGGFLIGLSYLFFIIATDL